MAPKTAAPVTEPLPEVASRSADGGHAAQPPAPAARARWHHALAALGPLDHRRRGAHHALAAGRRRARAAAVDHARRRRARHRRATRRVRRAKKTAASRGSSRRRLVAPWSKRFGVSATRTSPSASARFRPKTSPCSRARPRCSKSSRRICHDARAPRSAATRFARCTIATTGCTSSARPSRSAARGCNSSRRCG